MSDDAPGKSRLKFRRSSISALPARPGSNASSKRSADDSLKHAILSRALDQQNTGGEFAHEAGVPGLNIGNRHIGRRASLASVAMSETETPRV